MYTLLANRRILTLIKKLIEAKGEKVVDHKEYLITDNNPMPFISEHLKSRILLSEIIDPQGDGELPKSIISTAEESGQITNKVNKGQPVTVMAGKYKGVSGIVRDVFQDKCSVELNVWGKIKVEEIKVEDVSIAEKPVWA